MKICPHDGYPINETDVLGQNEPEKRCGSPCHPDHPGPCPNCKRKGFPGLATNEGYVKCEYCGHLWQPACASSEG